MRSASSLRPSSRPPVDTSRLDGKAMEPFAFGAWSSRTSKKCRRSSVVEISSSSLVSTPSRAGAESATVRSARLLSGCVLITGAPGVLRATYEPRDVTHPNSPAPPVSDTHVGCLSA